MATQRLINSTADLKTGLGIIQADLDFAAFASFVDDADMRHIIPAISYAGYTALCQDMLSDKKTQALKLLQKAGANFAIHYSIAFSSVQIGESGIFVVKDNRQLPASDKKTYMLRLQSRSDGFAALEAAVNFMEANLADFTEYAGDPVHQTNRRYYVNTTAQFSQGFNLSGNAELFSILKTQISTVEENYIDRLLGDEVSAALRLAITEGTTSDIQKQLLVRIAKAVAPLTIAEAIPWRMISFDATGLITPTIKNNIENMEVSTEADLQRLQAVMNRAQATGESEIAKLKQFLAANIDQFTGYIAPDPDAGSKMNVTPRKFYFV
jgi:hypothetical protein